MELRYQAILQGYNGQRVHCDCEYTTAGWDWVSGYHGDARNISIHVILWQNYDWSTSGSEDQNSDGCSKEAVFCSLCISVVSSYFLILIPVRLFVFSMVASKHRLTEVFSPIAINAISYQENVYIV